MKVFKSDKDKELWSLTVGYVTLPFYATPGTMTDEENEVWQIVPATFTGSLFQQIRGVLDSLTFYRHETFRFVKDDLFKKHFVKCAGVTPSYYVACEGRGISRRSPTELTVSGPRLNEDDLSSEPDDFSKWLSEQVGSYSADEWKVIMLMLFQQIPRYMLLFNAQFDFGWAKLTALPIRVNSLSIMLAKFPRIRRWLKNKSDAHKLEIAPFSTEAKRADLLECEANQRSCLIGWNLFVTPTNAWREYIKKVESGAHSQLGPRHYLARVGDLLHRNWHNFLDVFRAHVEAATIPCGDVASPEHPAAAHLVAFKPEGKVPAVPFSDVPSDFVVDPCDSGVCPARRKVGTKAEAAYVQEVPYVPIWTEPEPDGGDVRKGRRKAG